ncbi:MAG TPA: ATPase [Microbacteriaceae bacterium]|jgi:sensor histidine kinase regulating citrate/malate metabolism|nr:ATPase [Microbacteriaceae bacterium]
MTLSGRVFLLQLAVILAVLVAVTFVSISQSRAEFHDVQGQRMLAIAESFASTPLVISQMGTPQASLVLAPEMEKTRALSDASVVTITNAGGRVIASSDPTTVGKRADLVAASALKGKAWAGDITAERQQYIVANVPVLRDDGSLIGLIIVAEEYPPIGTELVAAVPGLLIYLGIGAGLGVLGSWVLSRLVRRGTRGLEPHEIAELADHREALLFSIREGVIGVGADGRVTILNKSAMELLGLPEGSAGSRVADLPLDDQIRRTLLAPANETETVVSTGARILVLNRRAVMSRGRHLGTVTTLRDRTELAELQSQLAMNQSITETMRAQTHEFFNHLHTVFGLIQLKEFDEVRTFIGTLTRRSEEINNEISERIKDPTVAALLVAKTSLARESGIRLQLAEDSALGPLDSTLAADVITVLGNLIDNAVDATAGLSDIVILVGLHDDASMITLSVFDPGPGVPEDLEQRIFSRGFTTKSTSPLGRGIGLALVRLVCSQRGGQVTVHTGGGARFEATLPYTPVDAPDGRP